MVIKSSEANTDAWARSTTSTEFTYPTNSGWDIGYSHDKPEGRSWYSDGDYNLVRVGFTTTP